MTPFLKQIAEVYVKNEKSNLNDFCFIFPNKRSLTFFNKYLNELSITLPGRNTKTITDFVSTLSRTKSAAKLEQLFILFNEYSKLTDEAGTFDQFLFWGEMILNDFSDVDRYLVDPDALFINVKRYKEIGSNYLSPEQIAIIRRYWGEDSGVARAEDVDRFWKHVGHDDDCSHKPSAKFMKLWEVLGPLYHAFNKRLADEGKASTGMMYRKAAEALKRYSLKDTLQFNRYIFIGFNVLTPVEHQIFSILRDCGAGDFYWDYNSPVFGNGFNRAGRFIERNIEEFKSLYDLPEGEITTLPEIEIIGVPSSIAQTKVAGEILADMADKKLISDAANAIDTAVVLPDESLFLALRRAIPYDKISLTNVTMGMPLKLTAIASLMRMIVNLQLRSRAGGGSVTFFYKDVNALLSDPAIRSIDPEQADALGTEIVRRRLFRVSPEDVAAVAPAFTPVFSRLSSAGDVYPYITDIIDCLSEGRTDDDNKFLKAYKEAVATISGYSSYFGVDLKAATLLRMVERTVASVSVPLIGEPLKGLQIMGVLETRVLDFDNVIMMSLNERTFPRKQYTGSFIPDALRRGYGIATTDFQESIFAYYFYRLISRAKNVKLIYDARTIGVKTGEMSRYLTQLMYLYGKSGKIKRSLRVFEPRNFADEPISIVKNGRILEKLKCYMPGASDPKYLSASAISTYISCPLCFYLSYVEGFSADEDMKDYIDSSTYGTVVHDTCEALYKDLISGSHGHTITKADIEALLSPKDTRIERYITSIVNSQYNKLPENMLNTTLSGQALIMANVIKESVLAIMRTDLQLTPFVFEGAEENMILTIEASPGLKFNFKQKIDRIDIVNGVKRIVDYKTGNEESEVPSLEECFDHNAKKSRKAVFQTLLYCYAYNLKRATDEPLKPCIYNLRKIMSKGPLEVSVAKSVVNDHRSVMEQFKKLLFDTVEEIFNPELPFFQTDIPDHCTFCGFKPLCNRKPTRY